jgi:hypothetical protein
MNTNEAGAAKENQDKGLLEEQLALEFIESIIRKEDYYVFPESCMTVCCLTLQNGFNIVGESACVSPENFNAEIGRKIARNKARDKIRALEAYLLIDKLSRVG